MPVISDVKRQQELLVQPLLNPKNPNPENTEMPIKKFIELISKEEALYPEYAGNCKVLITLLRKIFYNTTGWNTELIREAPRLNIKSDMNPGGEGYFLQKNSNALTNGYYADMGHVFAGLDAANYPHPVTILPDFLMYFYHIVPSVESNLSASTWLGDQSSNSGEFFLRYKKWLSQSIDDRAKLLEDREVPAFQKRELLEGRLALSNAEKQKIINGESSGEDMLGNIDGVVIAHLFPISETDGLFPSEILTEYYLGDTPRSLKNINRFEIFCKAVGLRNWNGVKFSNENNWKRYYAEQLRTTTAFYVTVQKRNLRGIWWSLMIWIGKYKKVVEVEMMMEIFLIALKKELSSKQ